MYKLAASLLVTTFLLGANVTNKQEQLVGHWECSSQEDGAKSFSKMEYVRNGTSNATIEIHTNESGVKTQIEMFARGTWEVNENELLESIEKLSVLRATINGEEFDPSMFKALKDNLEGISSGSEIIKLDGKELIVKNAGKQMTCLRL